MPAAEAGGRQLIATYYVDDAVASLTQDGVARTMVRDPAGRVRLRQTTGGPEDELSHYGDDSDSPSWIKTGSNWERQVGGIGGDQIATVDQAVGQARRG
jgi:hypothetical protein